MNATKDKIDAFRKRWYDHYNWISLELSDEEIKVYLESTNSVIVAVGMAVDYQLANGIGEVVE